VFVTHDVDEALTLADRIVVFPRNAGGVVRVLEVPDPRTVTHEYPDRHELRAQVRDALHTSTPERTS